MNNLVDIVAKDAEAVCNLTDLSEIQGKTILLTGASGLLGGYFIASLKQLATKYPKSFTVFAIMQNEPSLYLRNFLSFEGANILQGDLTDSQFYNNLPRADLIIHGAGYGQPGLFMENPIKTIQLNTTTTIALLEKLIIGGKFLFISTSEVYSGLKNPPFKEFEIGTTNTNHPRSCYIEAKRCGEAICQAYRDKGVSAKSARLALAYGPGTKKGDKRVINTFIQKALSGQISLLDQGQAKRTYCYISDAVEIMWNILLNGKDSIYNVGGNSRTSIRELALKIGDYLKVPVNFPKDTQDMVGAPDDVYLDLTKIRDEFGKTDFVPFDEGLKRTIEWQKSLYNP